MNIISSALALFFITYSFQVMSMEDPIDIEQDWSEINVSEDNAGVLREKYEGLIPTNLAQNTFNNLAWKGYDYIELNVSGKFGAERKLKFYLGGYQLQDKENNTKIRKEFDQIRPSRAKAINSHVRSLHLVNVEIKDGWLYLTYKIYSTIKKERTFTVKTQIPPDFPFDVFSRTIKISDQPQLDLIKKYYSIIPLQLYHSHLHALRFTDQVYVDIEDILPDSHRLRRQPIFLEGYQKGKDKKNNELKKEFINNQAPSSMRRFAYDIPFDLLGIEKKDDQLVLEYGYKPSRTANAFSLFSNTAPDYYKFKIATVIPPNFPNDKTDFLNETLDQKLIKGAINEGPLAGLNARDLGATFHRRFAGKIFRSQFLADNGIDLLNNYIRQKYDKNLKTDMNANTHGFGKSGGSYSMLEIEKCKELGITCIHPYSQNPDLRAYVDGTDPRDIPKDSNSRGNVYKRKTVNFFVNKENQQKLGIICNGEDSENATCGFGTKDNFSPITLEGDVKDLLISIKNFLNAGLPGVFHCKGGIHRTGQIEALIMLLFANHENQLAIWANSDEKNLKTEINSKIYGNINECGKYLARKSDKSLWDLVTATWFDYERSTPLERHYVLTAQGMPRKENIGFIRAFGNLALEVKSAVTKLELEKQEVNGSSVFAKINLPIETQAYTFVNVEVIELWLELIKLFNKQISQ
jgi:hypothetical protein